MMFRYPILTIAAISTATSSTHGLTIRKKGDDDDSVTQVSPSSVAAGAKFMNDRLAAQLRQGLVPKGNKRGNSGNLDPEFGNASTLYYRGENVTGTIAKRRPFNFAGANRDSVSESTNASTSSSTTSANTISKPEGSVELDQFDPFAATPDESLAEKSLIKTVPTISPEDAAMNAAMETASQLAQNVLTPPEDDAESLMTKLYLERQKRRRNNDPWEAECEDKTRANKAEVARLNNLLTGVAEKLEQHKELIGRIEAEETALEEEKKNLHAEYPTEMKNGGVFDQLVAGTVSGGLFGGTF